MSLIVITPIFTPLAVPRSSLGTHIESIILAHYRFIPLYVIISDLD